MVKKKTNTQETAREGQPIAIEMTPEKTDLRSNLAEIKKHRGVVGYILKDTSSAIVDLNEPAEITDYAVSSSTAYESASELSDIFDLGEVKRMIVEGRQMKMLLLNTGESKASVFLEKDADADGVSAKLRRLV